MTDGCRFGVNYVPSKNWLYSWQDWDGESVRRDLEAVRRLGFDHIRAHCLWPLIQPNRSFVSPVMLARLGELVDIAADCGLDVSVCVLNGWMSGSYFRPFWQAEAQSVFTDPDALSAEKHLIEAIAGALEGRPNVIGLDLGNEPNVMAAFAGNAVNRAAGDQWLREMLGHAEQVMPSRVHVAGVDHVPWLSDEGPFSREELGRAGSASVIHSWVYFTGALERFGPDGLGTIHLARYLVELARAFGSSPSRPVWLQEIGVSAEWIPEHDLPGFAERILSSALLAEPWGVTWWCSHDVDRSLVGFDPLEYDLGLLTVDNEVKPMGAAVSRVIARYREEAPVRSGARSTLILPPGRVPDLEFAEEYFRRVGAGEDPVIRTSSATPALPMSSHESQSIVDEARTPAEAAL